MFDVDTQQIRGLASRLYVLNSRGIPHAVRFTLNDLAFKARAQALKETDKDMILRVPFTHKSIRVTRAQGYNIGMMASYTGSIAHYLERQEDGGTYTHRQKMPGSSKSYPIPTRAASGESDSPEARQEHVLRSNRMSSIKLQDKSLSAFATNKKQQLAIKMQMAADGKGSRFYHEFSDTSRGIYTAKIKRNNNQRISRKNKRTRNKKLSFKLIRLWNLSEKSVDIKPTHWLEDSKIHAMKQLNAVYKRNLRAQLDRAMRIGF
jgi:hypothetical protein